MELMRGLAFVALLFAGSAVGAELRQAEVCGDGTTHQAGYCPAVLSNASCSATGATTGSCSAASDEADGTRYVCATSNNTALTGAEIEACSGGAAIGGSSAAETGSNNVSLSGLTTDATHYGQVVNESPEGWYSNRLVSSSFTPTSAGSANAARINAIINGRTVPFSISTPADPVTDSTINVTAGSFSSLQTAVATDGALVNVPAGTYTGSLSITGSNVDVVCASGATINGDFNIGQGGGSSTRVTNVRITGCDQTGGNLQLWHSEDVLVDDVYFTTSGGTTNEMSGWSDGGGTDNGWNRIAFINTTIDHGGTNGAGDWAWYTHGYAGSETQTDLWILNAKMLVDGAQTNRFQGINRMVMLDSALNSDFGTVSGQGLRLHWGVVSGSIPMTNVYIQNVMIAGSFQMNYGASGTQTQDVSSLTMDGVHRYNLLSGFYDFANQISGNTGTVSNFTSYGFGGTNPGSLSVSPLTNGGGNGTGTFDGSTPPTFLPDGATTISTVGAVR